MFDDLLTFSEVIYLLSKQLEKGIENQQLPDVESDEL